MNTILIVDDRADNRDVITATLSHRNYRLLEATRGEEALAIARKEKPDLIISDVLMPKMDGYEFVQQLRGDPAIADTTVIFYTASYIEDESRSLAKACGVNHVIVKPAEPEDILKAVDCAFGEESQRSAPLPTGDFNREHLHLVTDKLSEKVEELEKLNETLLAQAEMLNRARDAIIVRNFQDENITFWNHGAERLYGWSSSEAVGRPIGELIFTNSNDRDAALQILASSGEFRGELRQATRDGREVVVDGRATLVRNADGTPRSVLLIHTEITEQKKLETQLLRNQRLESIGTLASGVAHDLNNILTPILICAEALRGNPSSEDAASMISLVEQSAKRGAAVVKQVLTFARGIEGERVMINPRHLIDEMIDIAHKTFSKSIEITSRYPEDLWSIESDPTQLHQVLLNLAVNARDAMPDGGSLVLAAENFSVDAHFASMTPGAKPGPHVLLKMTDTGAGMPRSVIDKIFDPFFTTKEVGKGTGLGLSTVVGIVKSHDGFISVYSEVGRGTTFKIFLPAKLDNAATHELATHVESLKGNGELILVVDDEPSILQVTKLVLEGNNYAVLCANDGPEALAIFAKQMDSINAVLTDIILPYMDGVALIRAFKKMKPDLLFIASSGQGEQTRLSELQGLKVSNFLTKPYDTEKLLSTLKATMEPQSAL